MTALDTIQRAGFTLRAAADDRIGVTPIEHLSDEQRVWIGDHRAELLDELRAESTDTVDDLTGHRWSEFLVHCRRYGLHPRAVAADFNATDISDLCAPEHDDLMLRRCARTLAADSDLIAASAAEQRIDDACARG